MVSTISLTLSMHGYRIRSGIADQAVIEAAICRHVTHAIFVTPNENA